MMRSNDLYYCVGLEEWVLLKLNSKLTCAMTIVSDTKCVTAIFR